MTPTWPAGASFVVWKGEAPVRGDVIVFRYPLDPRVNYVQRIIAVGGDRVSVRGNVPIVNGAAAIWADEQPTQWFRDGCAPQQAILHSETLAGRTWPIVTNAGLSGLLAEAEEVEVPEGHYYVMGDNRDNSEDSRRWGTVPAENVRGVAAKPWAMPPPCAP